VECAEVCQKRRKERKQERRGEHTILFEMDPQVFMAKHVGRIEREKQMQRYETSYTASHRTVSDKYVPAPSDSCSDDEDDDVGWRTLTPSTTYTRESKRPYSGRAGSVNWTPPPTSVGIFIFLMHTIT
jgi:hypothetical protein